MTLFENGVLIRSPCYPQLQKAILIIKNEGKIPSMARSKTRLLVNKENFKFSAAHFLIFNETEAEKLHGHNYQVSLEIELTNKISFADDQGRGFSIDFKEIKSCLKDLLNQWDEMVILPQKHPDFQVTKIENPSNLIFEKTVKLKSLRRLPKRRTAFKLKPTYLVHFRDRLYMFPVDEVLLLPIVNTSVEAFSSLLAQMLYKTLKKKIENHSMIQNLSIYVEETKGQGACSSFPG